MSIFFELRKPILTLAMVLSTVVLIGPTSTFASSLTCESVFFVETSVKALDPALTKTIESIGLKKPHPRFEEIVTALKSKDWFKESSLENQQIAFYMINDLYFAAHQIKGTDADSLAHRRLLENTADFLAFQNIELKIDNYALGGDGGMERISDDMSVIHIKPRFTVSQGGNLWHASTESTMSLSKRFRNILAHEVSHAISMRSTILTKEVAKTPEYFFEEYRAYQVGHFAEFGKLPSKSESARFALNLLFNAQANEVYIYIVEGFFRAKANDWAAYRPLLENLGVLPEKVYQRIVDGFYLSPKGSSNEKIRSVLSVIDAQVASTKNDTQPLFIGWDGFLTNDLKK